MVRLAVVTGSAGHLGSNLVELLRGSGWRVRGVDLRPHPDRLSHGPAGAPALEAIRADVGDRGALVKACQGADVVFHMAMAYAAGPRPELVELARVGVDNAIAAVEASGGATRLVLTSSTATVGDTADPEHPRDEGHWNSAAVTGYQQGKIAAERRLWSRVQAGDLDAVAVLPAMTVGPGDDRLTASNARIRAMLRYARVPVWFPGGTGLVDVRDVARGHVLAAERGASGQRYILNAANLTFRELMTAVRRVRGLRGAPPVRLPERPLLLGVGVFEAACRAVGREPFVGREQLRSRLCNYAWFDSGRARAELGWSSRPVADTLRDTARFLDDSGRVFR